MTVKKIGNGAFTGCGASTSPSGNYQSLLTCIPLIVTEGNCAKMGIDDEAVRAYNEQLDRKMKGY